MDQDQEKKPRRFWLDDYKDLYQDGQYFIFFPAYNMSRSEQLNAIARFSIYLFVLFALFAGNMELLFVPLFLILATIVLDKIEKNDPDRKAKKEQREINKYHVINETNEDPIPSHKCEKPTENNPFMNTLVSDTRQNERERPEACSSVQHPEISKDMLDNFHHDLYMDVGDAYERGNSYRQFYSVPVSHYPNDQQNFAEFCYKIPFTCKSDQEMCLKYEDLRYKSY